MHFPISDEQVHDCREKWTFPAKPNLPHVMSIDFGPQTGDMAGDALVMAGKKSSAHLLIRLFTLGCMKNCVRGQITAIITTAMAGPV